MAIELRDAHPDELDAAARVMLAAYAQYAHPDLAASDAFRAALRQHRHEIGDVRSRLATARLIVALDHATVVGAVTFYPPDGLEGYGAAATWPEGWAAFRLLAVDPPHRGRGLARSLTQECMRRSRQLGAPVLALHTTAMNDVALGMYQRMGWTRAPRYDHFPAPEVCIEAYALAL